LSSLLTFQQIPAAFAASRCSPVFSFSLTVARVGSDAKSAIGANLKH